MNILSLSDVSLVYGSNKVLDNISVDISNGDIGCFLGPSGSGKTTLLRAIAGFDMISKGTISLNGSIISSAKQHTAPEHREIGMVFQDYSLFPHLNIADNVAFGLNNRFNSKVKKRVSELLDLVNMSGYEKRFAHQLSGGQQQRIAFIRALAPKPRLLLLDEAFGSQDLELRMQLARQFRQILKHEQTSAVLVTHDQTEAFAIADSLGVMFDGRLHQWDTAYSVYHRPINRHVARFVGQGTFLDGRVISERLIDSPLGKFSQISGGVIAMQRDVVLLVRPDDVFITEEGKHRAKIISRLFQGSAYLYTLELEDGNRIMSLAPSHDIHQLGDSVRFQLDMQHCVILEK